DHISNTQVKTCGQQMKMKTSLSQDSILLILIFNVFKVVSNQPLHLSLYLEQGNIETAKRLSLVNDPTGVIPTSYSGFFTVDEVLKNHLWFWFIPAINSDPKAPLVIWLTSGPGCSTMLNMFNGNGPLKLTKYSNGNDSYERRVNSWAQTFSMLYIDNIVYTGYSYSDSGKKGIKTTKDYYTQDLYSFIQQFYKMFSEMKEKDLYVGGVGPAFKYAVSLAYKIHEDLQAKRDNILLKGIYAGSPLLDGRTQLKHIYEPFYSLGFISYKQRLNYTQEEEMLNNLNEKTHYLDLDSIFYKMSNLTLENINTFTSSPDTEIKNVMSTDAIKSLLHVGNNTFELCNLEIYTQSADDVYQPLKPTELVTLLENYKVLLFTAVFDGIISSPGLEAVLMGMPWSMQSAYNDSVRTVWREDNVVKGFYTHVGNLCRVVIHNAGMHITNDQPNVTVQMMEDFWHYGCISNQPQ
ncbi:serine carboxypeptidase CPVL, partial [Biomphalaria pfeifferi]